MSERKVWKTLLILAGVLPTLQSGQASALEFELKQRDSERTYFFVVVSGEIKPGDCGRFSAFLRERFSEKKTIEVALLKSPGGVLSEGLCIGRVIRGYGLVTVAPELGLVSEDRLCASACSLAWLGGLRRLGVSYAHHPYISGIEGADFGSFSESLVEARSSIFEYVSELNLPQSIGDLVLSASSDKTVSLSAKGLGIEYDPIFLEYVIHECGAGLTEVEKNFLAQLNEQGQRGQIDQGQGDPIYNYEFERLTAIEAEWVKCADTRLTRLQMIEQTGDK